MEGSDQKGSAARDSSDPRSDVAHRPGRADRATPFSEPQGWSAGGVRRVWSALVRI